MRQKEARWTGAVNAVDYVNEMLVHDAWCAAFVLPRSANDSTYRFHTGHLLTLEQDPNALSPVLRDTIERLAGNAPWLTEAEREQSYRFFHWHLRFPDVFRATLNGVAAESPACGWSGGFDVVLGNPPWERVKLTEQEWFSGRHDGIVNAPNSAARKRLIADSRPPIRASTASFLTRFGVLMAKAICSATVGATHFVVLATLTPSRFSPANFSLTG